MNEATFQIVSLGTGTILLILSLGLPMWASAKGRRYKTGPFLSGLLASFVFYSAALLGLEKVQGALADIWGAVGLIAAILCALVLLGLMTGGGGYRGSC